MRLQFKTRIRLLVQLAKAFAAAPQWRDDGAELREPRSGVGIAFAVRTPAGGFGAIFVLPVEDGEDDGEGAAEDGADFFGDREDEEDDDAVCERVSEWSTWLKSI